MFRTGRIVLLVAGLALVMGCGRSTEKADTQADTQASTGETAAMETPAEGGEMMATAVELDGKIGCAHCTYHVTDSCALAMESDAGDVVLLDAGDRQDELMAVRYDQPRVHLMGKVSEVNGQKIIYADTIELQ